MVTGFRRSPSAQCGLLRHHLTLPVVWDARLSPRALVGLSVREPDALSADEVPFELSSTGCLLVSLPVSLEWGGRTEMPLPVLWACANDAYAINAAAKTRDKIFIERFLSVARDNPQRWLWFRATAVRQETAWQNEGA
jgi:hypothetical protein